MKVAIAGGTGFVGKALVNELLSLGHEVFILTRKTSVKEDTKKVHFVQWLNPGDSPEEKLQGVEVIVNLAGESINSGRWNSERKKRILNSRISATNEVLRIIQRIKPKLLLNASAIGYYGTSESETFTEDSTQEGNDFLASTVSQWEELAKKAESIGVRTVLCRFGIILDKSEGALPRIALPYKLFAGGTVGLGTQWLSWIHIQDVVGALIFLMTKSEASGPVNFTAPNPVRMKEFGKTLGLALHKPHWLPVPEFALRTLLGEMSILVLEGQKVLPQKLNDYGYAFKFDDLRSALKNIYQD